MDQPSVFDKYSPGSDLPVIDRPFRRAPPSLDPRSHSGGHGGPRSSAFQGWGVGVGVSVGVAVGVSVGVGSRVWGLGYGVWGSKANDALRRHKCSALPSYLRVHPYPLTPTPCTLTAMTYTPGLLRPAPTPITLVSESVIGHHYL